MSIRETLGVSADYSFAATVNEITYPVPVEKMTAEALLHVFEYGLQRFINDRTGGKDKTAEDKAKIAKETVARLTAEKYERRASGGESDPVMNWVRNILRDKLLADKTSDKAKAYKALKDDSEGKRAMLDSIFAAQSEDVQKAVYAAASAARQAHLATKAENEKKTGGIAINI